MAKINVYLPDELAAAVRAAGFPVSPVCQHALADAVRKVGAARAAIGGLRDPGIDPARLGELDARIGGRLTPRLRRALDLADEASGPASPIATKHLLAGLLAEGANLAVGLLVSLGIDADDLRAAVVRVDREEPAASRPPATGSRGSGEDAAILGRMTLPARAAVAAALEASIELGHNYLGCEHLLLGLLADGESGAGGLLKSLGMDAAGVRRAVNSAVAGYVQAQNTADASGPSKLEEIIRRLDAIEARLTSAGV